MTASTFAATRRKVRAVPVRERPAEPKGRLPMRAALLALPLLAALAGAPLAAALPPQHQRVAELRAVLADPAVVRALGATPVDRVEHAGPDLYRVSAGRCHVDVAIVSRTGVPPRDGPRQFVTRAGARRCAGE